VLLIAAGAVLIFAPQVVGLSGNVALLLGVAGVAAGVAVLVSRMRERSVDDGDDGAVV
jgi:membrane-bound ClpP family serine protease